MNDVKRKVVITRFISTLCRNCNNSNCLFLLELQKEHSKVEIKGEDILIFINNELLPTKFEFRKDTLTSTGQPTCFQENEV